MPDSPWVVLDSITNKRIFTQSGARIPDCGPAWYWGWYAIWLYLEVIKANLLLASKADYSLFLTTRENVCFLKMGTVEKGDVKLSFLVSVSPFISVLTLGAEISPDFWALVRICSHAHTCSNWGLYDEYYQVLSHQLGDVIQRLLRFILFLMMRMGVCADVGTGAHRAQKKVLKFKFRFSVKAVHALNCSLSSPKSSGF